MVDDREAFRKVLRIVAPGTPLREGLESILRARTGALILLGDSPSVMKLVDGGFRIDSDFLPSNLYELAKMDGSIILTPDARRILYANATLVADPATPSSETGIRHRTAERVARQTGELVIAISQRRNVISLYRGQMRYQLRDISVILTKANQALQTLEKYRSVLDRALTNLSALELADTVSIFDVVQVVQRIEMVLHVVQELDGYVCELGTEGRLVSMQMDELTVNLVEESQLVLRDYMQPLEGRAAEQILDQLLAWDDDSSPDLLFISRLLGFGNTPASLEQPVSSRGLRILRKIPRLPMAVIENMVNHFGSLQRALVATIEQLDEVEGIGEVRARAIREGLRRLHEKVLLERMP